MGWCPHSAPALDAVVPRSARGVHPVDHALGAQFSPGVVAPLAASAAAQWFAPAGPGLAPAAVIAPVQSALAPPALPAALPAALLAALPAALVGQGVAVATDGARQGAARPAAERAAAARFAAAGLGSWPEGLISYGLRCRLANRTKSLMNQRNLKCN